MSIFFPKPGLKNRDPFNDSQLALSLALRQLSFYHALLCLGLVFHLGLIIPSQARSWPEGRGLFLMSVRIRWSQSSIYSDPTTTLQEGELAWNYI